MNSSGMLYSDAVLLSIIVYAFWYGWVVTLAGEAPTSRTVPIP